MKLFLAIFAGIVIGASAGLGVFYHHELTNFRVAAWKYPPIVVDCTFGTLDIERINESIAYWDNLNHKVGFVELNPSSKVCMNDQIHGFIIIKNANLPKLLEHELGHAFGYKHLDIDGHIMNSNYDYSGYDFWD